MEEVAGGTEITLRRPSPRSQRALLTHRAPGLDGDEEPFLWPRMQDAWEWKVPVSDRLHSCPRKSTSLASTHHRKRGVGVVHDAVVGKVAGEHRGVEAPAAVERVVAGAAGEEVVAVAADQRVVAGFAVDDVGGGLAAGQRVVACGAGNVERGKARLRRQRYASALVTVSVPAM